MYKVKLVRRVLLSNTDNFDKEDVDKKILTGLFVKELTLPFEPYIGLALVNGRFLTPPIKSVTFDLESDVFHCEFETDRTISKRAKEIEQGLSVDWSPDEVNDYLNTMSLHRIEELIEDGWKHKGNY